jgi:hypothetical protein
MINRFNKHDFIGNQAKLNFFEMLERSLTVLRDYPKTLKMEK